MSVLPGNHATSYTSRSCAMSWVIAAEVSMFHTVQVVSMEEVTIWLGAFSFHEKFVSGAPVEWFWTLLCCRHAQRDKEREKEKRKSQDQLSLYAYTYTRARRARDQKHTRTPDKAVFNVNRCPLPLA